ncbi:oxidative stress-responsive serine-rich protein 1 [Austrofundulus limnaeus]|uniref:Oxidative stress-responsive serine-rich protein 1 n=1 Tax=Austrofundulus limnaeus TaxID=52670 RepID=A0A2I4CPR3_AUSLI|nr:PREDICTED: oxidative stress-responsive serine-rich protein 1 [Austrofundulus limnaeus]
MEAGGKDCEEETLQTAFKKLRVDAESLPGAVSVSEAMTPRAASWVCVDGSGAKTKLSCPKDNWHCCVRKTSRGTSSRSQRRRRSKSPILHPPKFTYCSSSSALPPPAGCLKHQRLSESAEPHPAGDEAPAPPAGPALQTEPCSSVRPGCVSPLVFGVGPGYEKPVGGAVRPPSLPEITTAATSPRWDREGSGDLQSSRDRVEDFRSLSELHSSCSPQEEAGQEAGPQCSCRPQQQGWSGMEVYSFTGLRGVISECEASPPSRGGAPRTVGAPPSSSAPPASGSPRSCSEQARAYVDDITIEDLSGYMEYYLYIPKKMSHMAEMMYT